MSQIHLVIGNIDNEFEGTVTWVARAFVSQEDADSVVAALNDLIKRAAMWTNGRNVERDRLPYAERSNDSRPWYGHAPRAEEAAFREEFHRLDTSQDTDTLRNLLSMDYYVEHIELEEAQ